MAVDGYGQDIIPPIEYVLGAVAVVIIDIENGYFSVFTEKICCNGRGLK